MELGWKRDCQPRCIPNPQSPPPAPTPAVLQSSPGGVLCRVRALLFGGLWEPDSSPLWPFLATCRKPDLLRPHPGALHSRAGMGLPASSLPAVARAWPGLGQSMTF